MTIYEGKQQRPQQGEIVIVVAKFNSTITERLLEGAIAKLKECHVEERNISVCRVPGAFEIPMVARRFAETENVLCVICLGAVIKGETSHDEHINRAVSLELMKICTETGTPTIFGMLTCNTAEQAIARSGGAPASHDKASGEKSYIGNKGYEAAEAAIEMVNLMEQLPEMPMDGPLGSLAEMFTQSMIGNSRGGNIYDTPFDFDGEDDDDYDDDDWDYDDEDGEGGYYPGVSNFPQPPKKKSSTKNVKKAAGKSDHKTPKKNAHHKGRQQHPQNKNNKKGKGKGKK